MIFKSIKKWQSFLLVPIQCTKWSKLIFYLWLHYFRSHVRTVKKVVARFTKMIVTSNVPYGFFYWLIWQICFAMWWNSKNTILKSLFYKYIVLLFRMQLWPVAQFFSLTFGWVCCCFAVVPTQKWVKKVGNWSELHSEKKYYL